MTKDDGRGRRGAGGSAARGEPVAGVLDDDERMHIEMQFGVPAEQVVRDHVISHALAAIASIGSDDVVFFGGTALSRTHLTSVRLSEDSVERSGR